MKRNDFYLIVALFSVISFTSCISGDNVQGGEALGVMGYTNNFTPVIKSPIGLFYSPTIANLLNKGDMRDGGCYIFNYTLDGDLPENAQSVVSANGYYTITLNAYEVIPSYNLDSYLTDTSKIMTDEVAIAVVFESSSYVDGYLFITQVADPASNLQHDWNMSYDYSTMMPRVEGDKNYYDVYVRATKKNSNSALTSYWNAYYMKNYLRDAAYKEKASLGSGYLEASSKFTLRFIYVSAIDKDTEAITWKNHPIDVLISSFLDE